MDAARAEHVKRIATELREAGASSYGAKKFASRYLPTIIHPEEHVMAVVYGRYREGSGLLSFAAGMLVATDRRVIFLDHKPSYTSTDEITYEVVSGVRKTSNGLFSTVTLHTRLGDFTVRFANPRGVDKFVGYIESRRLESNGSPTAPQEAVKVDTSQAVIETIDPVALNFLNEHDTAVLSTLDRTGNVHGATVYYFLDSSNRVCILTKADTHKARNILANQQVALTAYDAIRGQTVQLQGIVEVVTDPKTQHTILAELTKPRVYDDEVMHSPPVTTIYEGGYVALRVTPSSAHFTDFKHR